MACDQCDGRVNALMQKSNEAVSEWTRAEHAEAELTRLKDSWISEEHEIQQILGKALKYPPAYPDVSDTDDGTVIVGPHTAVTLAMEAADLIAKLRAND